MTFRYTNAYVGPFCVSYAEGNPGEIQKFQFPYLVMSREHLAQGLMITKGRIRIDWSFSEEFSRDLDEGASFAVDGPNVPLAVDAEATLSAMTPCAFLCITAAGIEQKVFFEKCKLKPGESMSAERYSLVAIAGDDTQVKVNGGDVQKGIRLIYGRNAEIQVEAVSSAIVGKFYLAG
jgi:hypothetical protein